MMLFTSVVGGVARLVTIELITELVFIRPKVRVAHKRQHWKISMKYQISYLDNVSNGCCLGPL